MTIFHAQVVAPIKAMALVRLLAHAHIIAVGSRSSLHRGLLRRVAPVLTSALLIVAIIAAWSSASVRVLTANVALFHDCR